MKTTAITIGMVCAASLCGAADATWMSNPADALWNFTSLNWGAGAAWTDGDNAVFGASETKAITIEEDVAPSSVSVTADGYSFDGTGVSLPPPWQVKYADTGVYVYFPKGTVLICR